MEVTEIMNFLEDNGLSEIKELKVKEDFIVIKCYYDFDKEEISAARAYSNEESDAEEESDEWYKDWFFSYLYDIAKDNVGEILEETEEEFEVSSMYKVLDNEASSSEYVKFITIFCNDTFEGDLEDVLKDYI
ncbi:hypothetical protein [Clostridium vincentii]|uniref:Uncharacterized protein n=1 Tax=Clostridium vincentii TaxID=52704 RepID=A0A2T0BHS1_9CLOT|nr:hypothetical protein [Clostridium vincentii]PRR83393.1 hypothetical protein CLVI_09400 [Clostridium vincentii]